MARVNRESSVWHVIEKVLTMSSRVLIAGPPGTGKTTCAAHASLRPGQPIFAVTLTEDMPAAELRGHWVPVEGRFEWRDGTAVAAWRSGGRLVLNEIDRASGDALTFLMAILDDPQTAALTLPSNETVRPAAHFSVVATMNGDPSTDLRPALQDRFPVAITVDEIHPKALEQLPEDLRSAAIGTRSIRVWMEFARLRALEGERFAARACFGHRADEMLTALRVGRA
jgi:MoxR-like ATPase